MTVVVDSPEVLKLIREALAKFLLSAHAEGFTLPIDFAVTDADGCVLREFTLEKSGKLVLGKTDDPRGAFTLPLTIYATDARRRTAQMRIDAPEEVN